MHRRVSESAILDAKKEANRSRFRNAINSVCDLLNAPDGGDDDMTKKMTAKIRNVGMLALGTNNAGLPIRRYFNWNIGTMDYVDNEEKKNVVIMYGDVVNEAESSDR
jgi:hypothetical protein